MPNYPTAFPPGYPVIDLPAGWQYVPDISHAVNVSGTAPVQIGAGRYRFTVPGGASTSHPNSGVFAVFPMFDPFKNRLGWGQATPYTPAVWLMQLEFHTEPSLTSDAYVRVGFCDSDDLTPAGFVGIDTEMQYTGGNAVPTVGVELFGSGSALRVAYAGPFAGGNKYLRGSVGILNNEKLYRPTVWGLDASGVDTEDKVQYATNPPMAGVGSDADGFIYIAAGRTSAAAGDAVIEVTATFFALHIQAPA